MLADRIASLSDDQAQRALLLFFEALPAELWQGGKPRRGEMDAVVDEICDAVPAARPLLEPGSPQTGVLAREVLAELSADAALLPHVETALARAGEPHLLTGPEVAAVALVLLAARVERVDAFGVHVRFARPAEAAKLVGAVTELIEKLQSLFR